MPSSLDAILSGTANAVGSLSKRVRTLETHMVAGVANIPLSGTEAAMLATTPAYVGTYWWTVDPDPLKDDKFYVWDGAAWNLVTGGGGGGGAPTDATYLTVSLNSTLLNERVLVAGSGLTSADGGAGGNFTLNVGAGNLITVGADTVGITSGSAQWQVPITGGSPFVPTWTALSTLVGANTGLSWSVGKFVVDYGGTPDAIDPNQIGAAGTSYTAARAEHVHEFHSYADSTIAGQEDRVLKSDASGDLKLHMLTLTDTNYGLVTQKIVSPSATTLTIKPTLDLVFSPDSYLVKTASNVAIQADNYASRVTGWRISYAGASDFRSMYADEATTKTFITDFERVLVGGEIIAKSAAKLAVNMTAIACSTTDLWVEEFPGATGIPLFQDGDMIMVRNYTRTAGTMTIGTAYGAVTYSNRDGTTNPPRQRYFFNCAYNNGSTRVYLQVQQGGVLITAEASQGHAEIDYDGTFSIDIVAGSAAIDFGVSGNGYWEVDATDGTTSNWYENSPYSQVVTWSGSYPGANYRTVRTRLGNLYGIFSQPNEYGLYAGNGTSNSDAYIRISNYAVTLYNLPIKMYDTSAGGFTVSISPGPYNPYIGIGSPLPTEYLSESGFWVGKDADNVYKMYIGTISGSDIANGLKFDGSTLTIKGQIIIQAGSTGYNNLTDAPPIPPPPLTTWGQIQGFADFPTRLVDSPSGYPAGLYLASTAMGYYNGSIWTAYIQNNGYFRFTGQTSNSYITWVGSDLDIVNGNLVMWDSTGYPVVKISGGLTGTPYIGIGTHNSVPWGWMTENGFWVGQHLGISWRFYIGTVSASALVSGISYDGTTFAIRNADLRFYSSAENLIIASDAYGGPFIGLGAPGIVPTYYLSESGFWVGASWNGVGYTPKMYIGEVSSGNLIKGFSWDNSVFTFKVGSNANQRIEIKNESGTTASLKTYDSAGVNRVTLGTDGWLHITCKWVSPPGYYNSINLDQNGLNFYQYDDSMGLRFWGATGYDNDATYAIISQKRDYGMYIRNDILPLPGVPSSYPDADMSIRSLYGAIGISASGTNAGHTDFQIFSAHGDVRLEATDSAGGKKVILVGNTDVPSPYTFYGFNVYSSNYYGKDSGGTYHGGYTGRYTFVDNIGSVNCLQFAGGIFYGTTAGPC